MQKAHFIGIAGKGMSATALLLRDLGWEISGSDEDCYPPVSEYLENAHIHFSRRYARENIPKDVDLIVIGKNAKLVPETNEEVRAALESGVKIKSFPEVIGGIIEGPNTIVVAGSYGKSTCAALLAWCLIEAGRDPSYFIGEVTNGFSSHAHVGSGNTFVIEGDEYPSSHTDKRAKFLHYKAHDVLLTSATHDHINVYPTQEDYLAPFATLISSLPKDGSLVYNEGEPFARALAKKYSGLKISYGLQDLSSWHPQNISYGPQTTFDLMRGEEKIASLSTGLIGTHNIENIVGCSALLIEKGLVTTEELSRGVESFQGVRRRLELLTPDSSVSVYEGFGSSYEKARSAIEAMRLHFPNRRLVVVFEPHTFGWRNRANLPQYKTVFTGADIVFVATPEKQGATTHDQLSHAEILSVVGPQAIPYQKPDDAVSCVKKDDVVLILTSGDLHGTLVSLVKEIAERFKI